MDPCFCQTDCWFDQHSRLKKVTRVTNSQAQETTLSPVAYFNPSPWGTELGGSLCSRPAWSKEQIPGQRELHRETLFQKGKKKKKKRKEKKERKKERKKRKEGRKDKNDFDMTKSLCLFISEIHTLQF